MSNNKHITCISCPVGCPVKISEKGGRLETAGNECERGKIYALQEYRDPRRVLTGTVTVSKGYLPRLPVKTDRPLPLGLYLAAAHELGQITVPAPVRCGQLIAKNLAGSGVNLIATRSLNAL